MSSHTHLFSDPVVQEEFCTMLKRHGSAVKMADAMGLDRTAITYWKKHDKISRSNFLLMAYMNAAHEPDEAT
tara:strand:+ start:123 stop:338 length:216 start_codon:yes stop_codon:yes gene_type:complete